MLKKIVFTCFYLLLLMPLTPVYSQERLLAPLGMGQSTVTREVAEYTSLEQALMATILDQENKSIALLADDFEVWSNNAHDWQSKADWIKFEKQDTAFNIKNVSVRIMDDFAVVQFLLQTKRPNDHQWHNQIVVDIWRQSTHQLAVRYATDSSAFQNSLKPDNRRF